MKTFELLVVAILNKFKYTALIRCKTRCNRIEQKCSIRMQRKYPTQQIIFDVDLIRYKGARIVRASLQRCKTTFEFFSRGQIARPRHRFAQEFESYRFGEFYLTCRLESIEYLSAVIPFAEIVFGNVCDDDHIERLFARKLQQTLKPA